MRRKLSDPGWLRSDTNHGICKSAGGKYGAWYGTKFLGWADDKERAVRLCEADNRKRRK